jgi:type IV secretion system protein TrbG
MKRMNAVVVAVAMAMSAFVGFGQTADSQGRQEISPVVLSRNVGKPGAAGHGTTKPEIIPENKYPFAAIQKQLENSPSPGLLSSVGESLGFDDGAPAGWEPQKDVPLAGSAKVAVGMSERMSHENSLPAPGPDGRVLYTFGVGEPTLVSTPLQVSSIELQPGEKILGEPQIGDSARWLVTPIMSGTGDAAIPLLVVKPKAAGLSTTMIVATDRRTYYLRLISKPNDYIARLGFTYPDDQSLQWRLFLEKQKKEHDAEIESTRIARTGNTSIDKLYFDYTFKVRSGSGAIKPDRVMDDGEKTYIEMPAVTAFQELPTLVIEGNEGNEMVNFRVKGTTFVVDRLFNRAALVVGIGKHAEFVEIRRKVLLNPPAVAASPEVK